MKITKRCFNCGISDTVSFKVIYREEPEVYGELLCDACADLKCGNRYFDPEIIKLSKDIADIGAHFE